MRAKPTFTFLGLALVLSGCESLGTFGGVSTDSGVSRDTPGSPAADGGATSSMRDAGGPVVESDAGLLGRRDAGGTSEADGGGGSDDMAPWHNVKIVAGGFIPGIVFNAKEKDLVYVRTDMGGAYRFDPGAGRWISLLDWVGFEEWNLTGVESLATDPVEPDRLYIAAGTYTNDWTTMNGAILRSTDRGRTFARTNLPFKLGGNMPGRSMGERLVVDPNDNRVLYFGARSGYGLWKSTDSGATWAQVTSFSAVGTWADSYFKDLIGVVWVTFDARSGTPGAPTKTLYVGVADTGSSIYRSLDSGETWTAVPGQPTGYLPHHGTLGSNGLLYVTFSDTAGPYDGSKGQVWKLDTATGQWTDISPVASSSGDDYFGYGGLGVDAQHPDTLVVATFNSWWPDAILFRSIDAGKTWSRIWDWSGYPSKTLRYTQDISVAPWLDWGGQAIEPEPKVKLGWMIGALAIDPFDSNRMLYGTGATLYGSDNLTDWDTADKKVVISVKALGIEETAVIDLVSPPEGAELLSAVGDLGGFVHADVTSVPASVFTSPTFSTGTSLDFAESSPNFMVRVGNPKEKSGKSMALSWASGSTWYEASSQPALTGGGTVAVAASPSRIVWSPTGGQVSYSDGANSWTQSQGIPAEARVGSDRVNANKFYGSSGGKFYVSTNGGATFTETAATGLPEVAAHFKAMPGVEGDLWLAGGATGKVYGLWHSTDSGASFERLANVEEADLIGFGKAAPGQTYMALYTSAKVNGVRGLYRSDDKGQSWVLLTDAQHQFGCTNSAITGDPRVFGRVYVGTNGRGIVYRDAR